MLLMLRSMIVGLPFLTPPYADGSFCGCPANFKNYFLLSFFVKICMDDEKEHYN